MPQKHNIDVAIIDYGMGNLFNVKRACEHFGMGAILTSKKEDILNADAIILPGVGAFGDAMDALGKLNLVATLQKLAESEKPFIGICLGMQLLMSKSYEFGEHQGLGLVKGIVIRFDKPVDSLRGALKVPQVGWNRIYIQNDNMDRDNRLSSMIEDIGNGKFMYFNHSFYVKPEDAGLCVSTTRYGNVTFCSSLQYKNIFACQFHPERSGIEGLKIFERLAGLIKQKRYGRNSE